jgi:elongation factor Ts
MNEIAITANMVRDLREKTSAGIMDCKEALKAASGDMEEAIEYLRRKGRFKAAKKEGRTTSEGLVGSYIHAGGKIGVLVEVCCETDFVAKNEEFVQLVKDLSMQIAATNPDYIAESDVPSEVVEKEKALFRAEALESGKPEKVVDKIAEGRMKKFYQERCLLDQPFIKDSDMTVKDLLAEYIAKLGENITVKRFARYRVGEEIDHQPPDRPVED